MKEINTLSQLRAEKKKIEARREELEKNILAHWSGIKGTLNIPVNNKKRDNAEYHPNLRKLVKKGISIGINVLAGKLTHLANEKLDKFF